MAAILGLADEAVEALCQKISNVWPANYNCPGQLVISGETPAVDEAASRPSARARAARSGCASRARSTRRSSRARPSVLRPAVERVHLAEGRAAFMSTVTAKRRGRAALSRAADRAAHRARPVHAGGARAGQPGRHDVRRGRARQRARRFTEEDRQIGAHVLGQRPEVARRGRRKRLASAPFASLDGQARPRHRRVEGHRPRDRARSWPAPARPSSSAIAPARTRRSSSHRRSAARAVQADVSSPDDAKRLVEEAGDIDVLVNNAGLTRDGLLARMSDDDWRTVIDTNLSSVFYTCRAVTRPMMKKRGGSIVNISSVVGVHGNWGQTNYAASKAGIIGFTKSLARELGSRNIRANVVAPGLREDAAHRGAARGGDRRDGRQHAARRASPSRRRSRARYGSWPPTTPRSSRARSCSSTADWGCDAGRQQRQRTQARGDHRHGPGEPARERRRDVVVSACRGRVRRRARSPRSTTSNYNVHFACELKDFDPTAVDRPQGLASHGPLRADDPRRRAAGRVRLRRRDREERPSVSARRSRPASAACRATRSATTCCSRRAPTA